MGFLLRPHHHQLLLAVVVVHLLRPPPLSSSFTFHSISPSLASIWSYPPINNEWMDGMECWSRFCVLTPSKTTASNICIVCLLIYLLVWFIPFLHFLSVAFPFPSYFSTLFSQAVAHFHCCRIIPLRPLLGPLLRENSFCPLIPPQIIRKTPPWTTRTTAGQTICAQCVCCSSINTYYVDV